MLIFYENGRGIIVDKQGNVAMDLGEEVDPYFYSLSLSFSFIICVEDVIFIKHRA